MKDKKQKENKGSDDFVWGTILPSISLALSIGSLVISIVAITLSLIRLFR
ncbi:MAG: hypothetical protein LBK70_00310 [Clostridiales bacterium]|nr:hypothetical protein [Clostridiales bacterium]